MNTKDIDLFDEPMDYDIISEGDYYQDPTIPDSLPTYQYAVVPSNFTPPAGITYQTLAQIHIPGDSYSAVETEAERLAALQDGSSAQASSASPPACPAGYTRDPATGQCVPACPVDEHYDPATKRCVPDNACPLSYYFDESTNSCQPYRTTPPPTAPDAQIPAGKITVWDTQLSASSAAADGEGVRNVRMIARRWFKVEHTYTNTTGNYTFTKHFKHKVKVFVEFENGDASIRNIRGIRLWQMFFPVRKELGIFDGNKSNITYHFIKYSDYRSKGDIYYAAATTHNGVQEYREFAPAQGIGLPPQGINIFISRNALVGNAGSTPMFNKRSTGNLPGPYVLYHIASNPSVVSFVTQILGNKIDVLIGYRYPGKGTADINQLLSDNLKTTVYHELTHAAHYAALGILGTHHW